MMSLILTALIAAAIGAGVAWSLAFDVGWDASRFAHADDCARDQRAAFDRGRNSALTDVHFARSVAATKAAQTRAENRKLGEALRGMFAEDVAAAEQRFDDAEAA
jgi:hypothetical protein